MITVHRQYIRPVLMENLTDESRQASGIDETLLFSSELDLDGALKKVNICRSADLVDEPFFILV